MVEKKFEPEGLFFVFRVPPKSGDPMEFDVYTSIMICYTEEEVALEEKIWADAGAQTHCVRVALEGPEVSIGAITDEELYLLHKLARDGYLHNFCSLMFKAIFAERLMRQAVNSG